MTSICPPPRRTLADIQRTIDGAWEALAGSPAEALASTGRLAAHLTAMERSVYPQAVERLSTSADTVAAARASSHGVMEGLRLLERLLAGDQHMAATPVAELSERAQHDVGAHLVIEERLCAELVAALSVDELDAVVGRYHEAVSHAPSRPHPHTPGHHGHPWSWALRIERLVDGIRDTLDARPAPVAKPPRVLPPRGRWTAYLLGGATNPDKPPSQAGDEAKGHDA